MGMWQVLVQEIHTRRVQVEADNEEEAIAAVAQSKGDVLDISYEDDAPISDWKVCGKGDEDYWEERGEDTAWECEEGDYEETIEMSRGIVIIDSGSVRLPMEGDPLTDIPEDCLPIWYRLSRQPNVCEGLTRIYKTKITAVELIAMQQSGATEEDLFRLYPEIMRVDLVAVEAFSRECQDRFEEEAKQVSCG